MVHVHQVEYEYLTTTVIFLNLNGIRPVYIGLRARSEFWKLIDIGNLRGALLIQVFNSGLLLLPHILSLAAWALILP